jgi:hypothetical protein
MHGSSTASLPERLSTRAGVASRMLTTDALVRAVASLAPAAVQNCTGFLDCRRLRNGRPPTAAAAAAVGGGSWLSARLLPPPLPPAAPAGCLWRLFGEVEEVLLLEPCFRRTAPAAASD